MPLRGLLPALALLLAARADADVALSLGSRVGAGYNSNAYLDAAVLPAEGEERAAPLLTVAPMVQLSLGPPASHRLTLAWDGELRQLVDDQTNNESLLENRFLLSYVTPPLAELTLTLIGSIEQLHVRQADDMGWVGGWGGLRVSRPLGYSVRAVVGYVADYDHYASGASASWELAHRLLASVTVRLAPGLTAEPGYTLSVVQADPHELHSTQHLGGLTLRWDVPRIPLELEAGYSFTALLLPDLKTTTTNKGRASGRTDLVHGVRGQAAVRLTRWLGLFARYDGVLGSSNQEPEHYARHLVLGGLAVEWGWQWSKRPSAGLQARPATPAKPATHVVELEVDDAPEVRQVAAVGSFNDWDATKNPLQRRGRSWIGRLELSPGRHQVMLSVDGVLRTPDGCPALVADGFGGVTCVVTVER